MRVIKNMRFRQCSESEVLSIAFHEKQKFIATCAENEPVLIRKYPYMKITKKIIHRQKPLLLEEQIYNLNLESNSETTQVENENPMKGPIITAVVVNFSVSGAFFVIGYTNGDILVFNPINWDKLFEGNFQSKITNLQFLNNDKCLFLLNAESQLFFLDTKTWQVLEKKNITTPNTGFGLISEDSKTLYIISDKKRVSSHDIGTLTEKFVFKGHKSGINMIQISPNGKVLASAGNDNKICLFDTNTGELIKLLLGHSDEVYSIAFILDGTYLISNGEDNTLRFWDLRSYKCIKILNETPNSFACVSVGEYLFLGNVDGEIRGYKIIK